MVTVDDINSAAGLLEACVTVAGRKHEFFFRSGMQFSDNVADALLLLALPAAMRCGGPLVIEAPTSAQLLKQVPAIQDIYQRWDSKLHRVEVIAPKRMVPGEPSQSPPVREVITFSGGVDSFYSVLESPAASLMFVHGLDVPLAKFGLRKRVSKKLLWAASELKRPLFEMETNVREFSDRYLKWPLAFGGVLSACALLLSRHLDIFSIPSGQSLEPFLPDGAHPALNPLFSTEDVTIRTVNCKVSRIDKVAAIAAHPVVQSALRVCWENRGNAYNCGVCEKCLRTMAALEVFGVLTACSAFDVAMDYGRLSRAVTSDPSIDMFLLENLQAAHTNNASPELIRSIEKSLDPRRVWLFRLLHYKVPRIFHDWSYRLFPPRQKSN